MPKKYNFYLCLGCEGFINKDKFVMCNSVENVILDFSQISQDERKKIINFLDNACGIFDSIITDYNKIVNIISLLNKQYSILNNKMLENIQVFLKNHKQCKIYLQLKVEENV